MDYTEKFLKHIWVGIRKEEERREHIIWVKSAVDSVSLPAEYRQDRQRDHQSPAAEHWTNCFLCLVWGSSSTSMSVTLVILPYQRKCSTSIHYHTQLPKAGPVLSAFYG